MRQALFVMAKEPRPGQVKTRLCPPLDHGTAARLYRCFLQDVLELVAAVPGVDPVVAYTPAEARAAFARLVNGRFHLVPQTGADLGARLENTFRVLFQRGYGRVAAVSTDSPDLPAEYLRQAFHHLERSSVVLGPCPDGGYYLIGMSRLVPELFREMPWSTDRVVPVTAERVARLGLELARLPEWHDVDTPDDLGRLCGELNRDAPPGGRAPRTAAFCREELHGFVAGRA
ncbi:MAG TPA: TIGR04282 family arsenosugar biosynthesis glycosyltransferase [Candidatus Sulfotelmatobacter sp.]|nr:TIGR04282 family arsenosugar biosynthesis glycosyltransferase [Candidatus Sulfotelmatobacter sp.]